MTNYWVVDFVPTFVTRKPIPKLLGHTVRKSAGLLDSDYCMSRVNISISSTRSDLNPRPMERKMDHELLL